MNLSKMIKGVQHSLKKHSPEILTGIGIAGMITTTVMAVRATPKALDLIDQAKFYKANVSEDVESDELTPIELIRTTWKCYMPAAIVGGISVLCLIGASSVNLRRNAALATAYTLSRTALEEYQEKVIEEIGEKKEREVRDKVVKQHIDNNSTTTREVVITGKGDTRCYDILSKREFTSSMDALKRAENELNRRMRDDMHITLNEFYAEIGLDDLDGDVGNCMGWNIDRGYIDLQFTSHLTEDGTPCLAFTHGEAPTYIY